MKLLEFVQEGVFDKIKAKPPVKMRLKDLTASNVKILSDEALKEYQDYLRPRRDRIWTSMNEIQRNINNVHKNTHPGDFSKTAQPGFIEDPHFVFATRWVRAGSEGEQLISELERETKVYSHQYNKLTSINGILFHEFKDRDTLKKKEGRIQAASDWPDFQQKHPENRQGSIPPKVSRAANLKPSLANPYFGRVNCKLIRQYAGHPAHYPNWSNDWKRRIIAMDELLTRNGKQGLEMMYAGTFDNGGNRFNFMMIGAGGNFLWRKYDPSPGAGQNDVYLNGKKMKTSDLEHMMTGSPKHVDSIIKAL